MISHKKTLSNIRNFCLECGNAKKLVDGHCTVKKCPLFENRQEMIEASQQLSIFTYAGFLHEYENIVSFYGPDWMQEMYCSDIREKIAGIMQGAGAKLPEGNGLTSWWSNAAKTILPRFGWRRNETQYRWTATGGKDYLYRLEPKRVLTF